MKNLRKVMSILLALVLILSLAACGKGEKEVVDNSQKDPVVEGEDKKEEVVVEEESKSPYDKYEGKDLGGRTIVVGANWLMVPDSRDPEPDPSEDNYLEKKAKWDNLKRIEAKYNVKIEALNIPWEEITESLTNSVLAGKPVADVINLGGDQVLAAVSNNQLLPIKDIAPANSDILNNQEVLIYGGEVLGDQYFVKDVNVPSEGIYMGYNKDIINSLGVEDPADLYAKGQWTYEKFLEYSRLATKDTDGDGQTDQYGYSGVIQPFATQLIAANDGVLFDEANRKQGFDDPKTMKALELVRDMYTEKLVYIFNGDLWDWGGNTDSYKEGKSAFFLLQTWMIGTGDDKVGYDFGVVPFPTGPDNNANVSYFLGAGGMGIPRGTENPEDVYMVLEELMNWWGDDFSLKSDGTMEWIEQRYNTEEDVARTIEISQHQGKVDNNGAVIGFPMGDIVGPIADGSMTVAQSVEAKKQVAQDAIDKIFTRE